MLNRIKSSPLTSVDISVDRHSFPQSLKISITLLNFTDLSDRLTYPL